MLRRPAVAIAAILGLFLLLAWPGAGERGVTSEEVQPYLERYPLVLETTDGMVAAMPPYEPGAPQSPRWVATPQWPVLAYDGATRMWPLFIRGHQTALGSYVGILLGPHLGGGIAGIQRSSVLLCLPLLLLAYALARRSWSFRHGGTGAALLAPALLALSFGTLFFGRTGYAFELASRVAMLAALVVAAPLEPLTRRRALLAGLLAAVAVLCRATIAVTLAPALAVLLAHPARAASWQRRALVPVVMGALPLAVVGLSVAVAPFHGGTAPLEGFPLQQLAARVVQLPGHLLVQLAWVGDAQAILGPMRSGGSRELPLVAGALLGLAPTGLALVRWWRGSAGDGERMLVVGLLGNVVGGAFLYTDAAQFQLGMALDPLVAIAVAEQVGALVVPERALAAAALALVVRAQSMALGLDLDARGTNPMFSGSVQRGTVAQLEELGVLGPELLTTTYNQAGVIEAWTGGAIRPVHGWPVLRRGPAMVERLTGVLHARQPRYVLLSVGVNPYEGSFTDNDAIAGALGTAVERDGGALGRQWSFPTESGAPGWRLVELRRP